MPAVTYGSTLSAILQWLVIVGIVLPLLTTRVVNPNGTTSGVIPLNDTSCAKFNSTANSLTYNSYLYCLNGTIAGQSYYFLNNSNPNGIQQQMTSITSNDAQINAGLLGSLGGLAFIPIALGAFIHAIFNFPQTIYGLFVNSFANPTNAIGSILLIAMSFISSAILGYFVVIYAMKLITPIVKTEIEDI